MNTNLHKMTHDTHNTPQPETRRVRSVAQLIHVSVAVRGKEFVLNLSAPRSSRLYREVIDGMCDEAAGEAGVGMRGTSSQMTQSTTLTTEDKVQFCRLLNTLFDKMGVSRTEQGRG